jgi:ATP-dependent helicase HrpA
LSLAARELGIRPANEPATYGRVHRALLTGLAAFVGRLESRREYRGQRGTRFEVSRASGVRVASAHWVMPAEIVETDRRFAHTAARVRPEWIERAMAHQVVRTYFDAHWDEKRGEAMVFERVALHGLTLIDRRRVRLSPLDPVRAREVLIADALVDDRLNAKLDFLESNRATLAIIRRMQKKLRRGDLVASEDDRATLYENVIPADIVDRKTLTAWYRKADADTRSQLEFSIDSLMRAGVGDVDFAAYPDAISIAGSALALSYLHDESAPNDGITCAVPLELLAQLERTQFEWLVPGLRRSIVESCLRALPRSTRRQLVPIPDIVEDCVRHYDASLSIADALSAAVRRIRGVDLGPEIWPLDELPAYLRMHFTVVDEAGAVVDSGDDLATLKMRNATLARDQFSMLAASRLERRALTGWSFGELPDTVDIHHGALRLPAFPGLEDHTDSVTLRLFESAERARFATRFGLRRLLALQMPGEVRRFHRSLRGIEQRCLPYVSVTANPRLSPLHSSHSDAFEELRWSIVWRVVETAYVADRLPRDRTDFENMLHSPIEDPEALLEECIALAADIFERYRALSVTLDAVRLRLDERLAADMEQQLGLLVYRGFVDLHPMPALRATPRYLAAIERRLARSGAGLERDLKLTIEVKPLIDAVEARYLELAEDRAWEPAVDSCRWLCEELRVAAFAQDLGTPFPISLRRLEAAWQNGQPTAGSVDAISNRPGVRNRDADARFSVTTG